MFARFSDFKGNLVSPPYLFVILRHICYFALGETSGLILVTIVANILAWIQLAGDRIAEISRNSPSGVNPTRARDVIEIT